MLKRKEKEIHWRIYIFGNFLSKKLKVDAREVNGQRRRG